MSCTNKRTYSELLVEGVLKIPCSAPMNPIVARILESLVPVDEFSEIQWRLWPDYYSSRFRDLGLQGGHLLDLGCGAGAWALSAAPYFKKITGIDDRFSRIQVAQELGKALGVGHANFHLGDIDKLTMIKTASVDCVLLYNVLQNVVESPTIIRETKRVLRPGGRVLIACTDWGNLIFCLTRAILELNLFKLKDAVANLLLEPLRSLRLNYSAPGYLRPGALRAVLEEYEFQEQAFCQGKAVFARTWLGFPFFYEIVARKEAPCDAPALG